MNRYLYVFILLCLSCRGFSQETASVYGTVTGLGGDPVFSASVAIPGTRFGTLSDELGQFDLDVPAGQVIRLVVSYLGYQQQEQQLQLQPGERLEINFRLDSGQVELDEVIIRESAGRRIGITRIDTRTLDMLPNVSGNLETVLLTLPGVASRNELSSQYSVRGGNFDENLVYVNDIEVQRPFLIRSGQQEGLSFINSDMVSSIQFSAGGFQAHYGDKMSSVLDIKYRRPVEFAGSVNFSLLGGALHLEGSSPDNRFTHTSGFRYKTSRYLLSSLETKGEYQPDFIDFQTFLTFQLTPDWEISFLGNMANNRFRFIPETRSTDFGTFRNPLNLVIYYEGQERDRFDTYTGAFTTHYHPDRNLSLKLIGSGFHSLEQENYDILGQYLINELDNRINSETYGDSILNIGVGAMLSHARNNLDAGVYSLSHLGTWILGQNRLKWGIRWQQEKISDRISEWVKVDSAGYSLPRADGRVPLYSVIKSRNELFSNRLKAYFENTFTFDEGGRLFYINTGIRTSWWDMNRQLLVSPRINFSLEPGWERDVILRLAAGYYFQPPFYKELRYPDGSLNRDLRAQRSIHFVLGGDYLFTAWDRPFKFTAELYYKHLDNLIPYKMDNVRLQYAAENMARGYAAGLEMKIHGEFVPGAESWASLSLMKTQEDIEGDPAGYYPRPTDQRFTAGIFFRDYLPNNPDYKVHLNLLYGTGLPFSPPDNDRYDLVFRMPDYKRVDIGFSRNLMSRYTPDDEKHFMGKLDDVWIAAEIFNLLGVRNTISYLWVRTVSNQENMQGQFAVPNYLTGRRFNIRISVQF